MLAALKARKDALESKLKEKRKLLKELCIKEGMTFFMNVWSYRMCARNLKLLI